MRGTHRLKYDVTHDGTKYPKGTVVSIKPDPTFGWQVTPVPSTFWVTANELEAVPCPECGCGIAFCFDVCHKACDPSIEQEEGPR